MTSEKSWLLAAIDGFIAAVFAGFLINSFYPQLSFQAELGLSLCVGFIVASVEYLLFRRLPEP